MMALGNRLAGFLGGTGRLGHRALEVPLAYLAHTGRIFNLLLSATYFSFVAPLRGQGKLRKLLPPALRNVGVRSFPIVALVSLLSGAILVLQTGDVLRTYGQLQEVSGLVALSLTRELGPLMTAFVMIARVGASFTAVLAAMRLNEEITALETMAINPVGYLVAPRFLSMLIMMPCLTVMSYLLGFVGGDLVAHAMFDISHATYWDKTLVYLDFTDLLAGLIKASTFGVLIAVICCYFGFIARGGPMGLGRYTMVAVVTSLVVVVVADAILTAFIVNYLL